MTFDNNRLNLWSSRLSVDGIEMIVSRTLLDGKPSAVKVSTLGGVVPENIQTILKAEAQIRKKYGYHKHIQWEGYRQRMLPFPDEEPVYKSA